MNQKLSKRWRGSSKVCHSFAVEKIENLFKWEQLCLKIDNHAFRAQFARERYEELVQQKQEQGREIMRDYRGFDKECLGQVSLDLGHNRLSVVVEHYMRWI